MIEFVPFEPWHLSQIEIPAAQAAWIKPGYAESLANNMAWTGFIDDRVVGCAGFAPQWEGRAIAWALFGREIPKRAWTAIIAKVRKELACTAYPRVEATVPFGFGAGCRLANALGFQVEGLLSKFGPDGSDHFLYARVT